MVKITFPDGSVREYEQGVTGLQIAESISPALARNVVSCGVNGETVELNRPINEDANVELYKFEDEQGKHTFWHTSAHLLAEALQELYPGIQFGFGPAVESGFFYDVMPAEGQVISENDFAKIEAKMMELAKKNEPVVRKEVSKADALAEFKADGQEYKCEHIEQDLEDGTITTYTQGMLPRLFQKLSGIWYIHLHGSSQNYEEIPAKVDMPHPCNCCMVSYTLHAHLKCSVPFLPENCTILLSNIPDP